MHPERIDKDIWARSLIQWGAEGGAYMSRKGEENSSWKDKSIMESNTPKEIVSQIERLGINTWGDILTTENTIAETLAKVRC